MQFFIAMHPPTVTAQEHSVRVVKGKPFFFDPPALAEAKEKLTAYLNIRRPVKPFEGALSLTAIWLFPAGEKHSNGEWRITKPDTDNLQKMLKDCMTKCRFWFDDAQVAREVVEKRWADEPCGIYIEITRLEGNR